MRKDLCSCTQVCYKHYQWGEGWGRTAMKEPAKILKQQGNLEGATISDFILEAGGSEKKPGRVQRSHCRAGKRMHPS